MVRWDGRQKDQLRPVSIEINFTKFASGSVLISIGDTKVICTAQLDEKVPSFLKGKGEGWLTAEYGMLPGCSNSRIERDRNKTNGRTIEIQRLIGRSLRTIVDLKKIGERTIAIDCDVIQADGGTRTASITGAYVALQLAVNKLIKDGKLKENPIRENVAAISVGIVNGNLCLDLPYEEDSKAEVDMNVIMTASGKMIEVQGTAEKEPFDREQLNKLLDLGQKGINELIALQNKVLEK